MSNATYNTLKRTETVSEFTFSATTRHREVELYAPVSFVIGGLDGRNHGRIGHTLENLLGLSVVLTT